MMTTTIIGTPAVTITIGMMTKVNEGTMTSRLEPRFLDENPIDLPIELPISLSATLAAILRRRRSWNDDDANDGSSHDGAPLIT